MIKSKAGKEEGAAGSKVPFKIKQNDRTEARRCFSKGRVSR